MNILQIFLVLINCSTCDAFQSLDDLEKFYKTGPAFDPFGISGYFYSSKVDSLTMRKRLGRSTWTSPSLKKIKNLVLNKFEMFSTIQQKNESKDICEH